MSLTVDQLPAVRGRLKENAEIADKTWFRVGGKAEVLFRPQDEDDLIHFIKNKPSSVPVTILGVASNLIVRDGGVDGVVIRLGREFAKIKTDGMDVYAGAGALDTSVAKTCLDAGIGGLEFLIGIPGTIGGALRMNAGAYGSDIKEILEWADALDENGAKHRLYPEDIKHSYRSCEIPTDWIFLGAKFRGHSKPTADIANQMNEIHEMRTSSQPVNERTGGSTFRNPPGHRAWELIDKAGMRGFKLNGAMISELHPNFMINADNATAEDLEKLGEEVRKRVQDKFGIELEWEIKRIGKEKK